MLKASIDDVILPSYSTINDMTHLVTEGQTEYIRAQNQSEIVSNMQLFELIHSLYKIRGTNDYS